MLKYLLCGLLIAGPATLAHATTLQEFQAQSPEAQGRFISRAVNVLATKVQAQNPQLGRAIVEYFANAPHEHEPSPGIADLMVQVMAAERLATEGKADLSKIQVESMIAYVVRQHFKV